MVFDPISLGVAATLTGGGVLANMFADRKRREAAQLAQRNADLTDAAYAQQAQGVNANALGRYSDFGGNLATESRSLGDYFSGAAAPGGSGSTVFLSSPSTPSSGVLAGERAKQLGETSAFTGQQGRALGGLRAFDTTLGTANRGVARDAQSLAQILSNRKNVLNLLPRQLADAENAGGFAGTLADLFRGGGKIATSYALNRPSNFGGY